MTSKATLNKENILEAIERHYGIISDVARQFRVSRRAIYNHINADDELKTAVDEARESLLDLAESALITNIKKGDNASIIFALKTKGRKRGYVERIEQEQSGILEVIVGYAKSNANNADAS